MATTRPSARASGLFVIAAACMLAVSAAPAQSQQPEKPATPEAKQPEVLWKYTADAHDGAAPHSHTNHDFADVLVRDRTVYALDRTGSVHAIDATNGERRWETKEKLSLGRGFGMAISVAPRVDALFVGSDTGVFAFERATGKQLWFTPIASGVAGPACTDTVVVAGGADGKVYGFDAANGRIVWEHDYLEDRPDDPPGFAGADARFGGFPARPCNAATDGKIVALSIFDQCRTLALDAATGKRLWDFRTQGWMYGRPAFGALHIFVGSQDQNFYGVDKQTGKLAWTVPTGNRVEASAAADARFVYFGSCDGKMYAVDHGVGRVAWQVPVETSQGKPAPVYSAPVVRGDVVYLATLTGSIYAVDRKTKKQLWSFEPFAKSQISDLAVEGDVLFVSVRRSNEIADFLGQGQTDRGEGTVVAIKLP